MKKRSLSGIKPTGQLHIGNYFGAIKQWIDLQTDYECFYFIADLHSLTSVKEPERLKALMDNAVLDLLALGIDPEKSLFYKQSDLAGIHTELTWYLSSLASMPYLMRAHAFKDAEAKNKDINVATFAYPLLMAADILLYDADVVPVGKDQRQHVEIARELARMVNQTWGQSEELLKEPQEYVLEAVETVPGTDGRKMSKSYGNVIPLFGSDEEIKKAVMGIVSGSEALGDPLNPDTDTIFALHTLFSSEAELGELRAAYTAGTIGYGDSKKKLLEKILAFVSPLRERRAQFENEPELVASILDEGARQAKEISSKKIETLRGAIGF